MKYLSITVLAFVLNACEAGKNPLVTIRTEFGDIEVEIFIREAPVTGANFLQHVETGVFNTGACFYRVVRMDNQPDNDVKIEVIQGGLYDGRDDFPPIAHETTEMTGIKHADGTLSMARSEPGTASTEFFICIGDQPELDFGGKRNPDRQGFSAFGKVTKGMDIVRKIQLQQDSLQYLIQPVAIQSIDKK
ncbi:MAG: peptidylprolyl isomerase [Tannerella sp.]|jgi:peptidyl-prolyl cis-trans isomerase A (cyclophilin A)|nr:peptidylprolyl isomerase [Tannerella sp.]